MERLRARRFVSLRRALVYAFVALAVTTASVGAILSRLQAAQSITTTREAEIAKCRGVAYAIHSVLGEALEESAEDTQASYDRVLRLVERGLLETRGVQYIRLVRPDGVVVAETGVVPFPIDATETQERVAPFPTAEAPILYDLTVPVGTDTNPTGVLRIGLAEPALRERAYEEDRILRRIRFLTSAFLVASTAVALLFIAWIYRRAQEEEIRLQGRERRAYLGTVASGIVHDVRHPLGSIRLGIDLAREDILGGRPEYARERLALLADDFRRVQFALDSFRDYSVQGEMRLQSEDLRPLVEEVVKMVRGSFAVRGIRVTVSAPASATTARVDAARFKQIILNLLLNASEAITEAGTIEVLMEERMGGIEILVVDSGLGIPSEILPEIFQAYYTTKSGGLGLGLSVVKEGVEDHGGSITVVSNPRGTSFRLFFPSESL